MVEATLLCNFAILRERGEKNKKLCKKVAKKFAKYNLFIVSLHQIWKTNLNGPKSYSSPTFVLPNTYRRLFYENNPICFLYLPRGNDQSGIGLLRRPAKRSVLCRSIQMGSPAWRTLALHPHLCRTHPQRTLYRWHPSLPIRTPWSTPRSELPNRSLQPPVTGLLRTRHLKHPNNLKPCILWKMNKSTKSLRPSFSRYWPAARLRWAWPVARLGGRSRPRRPAFSPRTRPRMP